MLQQVYTFSKFHILNKETRNKGKGAMAGRISDVPFNIDIIEAAAQLKNLGCTGVFKACKKQIQRVLEFLQLHPCYMEKLLLSDMLDYD